MQALDERALERGEVEVEDGVWLRYVALGQGPLVILLHGFPEFWYTWRHQLPALAQAGYRVVAPDMRGYHASSKPAGVEAYRLERLAEDVAVLIEELGQGAPASVVGHDWGGITAWMLAARTPRAIERMAVLNAPHPVLLASALRRPAQLRRSWYMLAFQLPVLPELALTMDGAKLIRGMLLSASARGTFTREEIDRLAAAFCMPGVATAALNYYRAMLRRHGPRFLPAQCPVHVIWGQEDIALGEELADPGKWAPEAEIARIEGAGHWVHAERPERVNALLEQWLADGH